MTHEENRAAAWQSDGTRTREQVGHELRHLRSDEMRREPGDTRQRELAERLGRQWADEHEPQSGDELSSVPSHELSGPPERASSDRPVHDLQAVSDDELLRRLGQLVRQSRRTEADVVAHIGEVEERRLFARFAFSSMYAYCTEALHFTEAEAYRRITVARAARKHPALLEMLRDGRLHLTGLALLLPRLTPANRDEVLLRATHASKREIEELVAELAPRPDVPSRIRKLPEAREARREPCGPAALPLRAVTGSGLAAAPRPARHVLPEVVAMGTTSPVTGSELFPERVAPRGSASATADEAELSPLEDSPREQADHAACPAEPGDASGRSRATPNTGRATVQPLSPGRYKVQFTASTELKSQLERLAALMRSEVPDGDIGRVIERAVAEKLERLEARRFGKTAAPRKTLRHSDPTPKSRQIPAPVRRAVHARDEGRCRFVDEQGRRCSERHRLEFHHRYPYGKGGDHSLGNVMLLCPQHNRYLAERDYGPGVMRDAVTRAAVR
jgi:5-methylcytosine-specific restriction endonuclease McrA